MNEQRIESLKKVADSIFHLYGWGLEVKEGMDEEIKEAVQ